MRLTIIKADNMVYVDGVAFPVDCSSLPAGFHALQWYGTFGEVEMVDRFGRSMQSVAINDVAPFRPLIDAWNTAKMASDARAANAVADAAAPSAPGGTVNVLAD